MTSLSLLPGELVDMIAKKLQGDERSSLYLANLSSTCRLLNCVVEPLLYQHLHIERDDGDARPLPLYLLVRTILNKSHLASHIQSIYVRGWTQDRTPSETIRGSLTEKEYRRLCSEKFPGGNVMHKAWTEGLKFGKADFFLAVLLSRCENLTVLDLDFYFRVSKTLVGVVLTHPNVLSAQTSEVPPHGGWLPCRNLKRVNCIAQKMCMDAMGASQPAVMDINHVASLLNTISPHEITATNIAALPLTHRLPNTSIPISLTRLVLRNVWCGERDLEMILAVTSQLRELVWKRLCRYSMGAPDPRTAFNCNILEEALLHVRETLVTLTVVVDYMYYHGTSAYRTLAPNTRIAGRLKALSSFSKLEKLHISATLLMGREVMNAITLADQLPPRLSHLTINANTYNQFRARLNFDLPLMHFTDCFDSRMSAAEDPKSVQLQLGYMAERTERTKPTTFWRVLRQRNSKVPIMYACSVMDLFHKMHDLEPQVSGTDTESEENADEEDAEDDDEEEYEEEVPEREEEE